MTDIVTLLTDIIMKHQERYNSNPSELELSTDRWEELMKFYYCPKNVGFQENRFFNIPIEENVNLPDDTICVCPNNDMAYREAIQKLENYEIKQCLKIINNQETIEAYEKGWCL